MSDDQPQISPDTVFRRRLAVRARKYRGKLFIDLADQALELDEVAEAIFRQLDGTASLREVGTRLAELYGIPVEEAIGDSAEFIAQLAAYGVVEPVTG